MLPRRACSVCEEDREVRRLQCILCALLLIVSAGKSLAQMTPAEAFGEGKGLGASAAPAVESAITSGTSATTVPHYSTTQPQANLFGGGAGSLVAPGAQQVSDCQQAPPDPDGRAQQPCEATNFLAKKSSTASFNFAPTDPVLVRARPITNDPASILGTMSGTYSACTPQTVSAPARKQTEVCAESRAPQALTCEKLLTVTVTQTSSCAVGTLFAGGSAARNWLDYMTGHVLCDPGRGLDRHRVQVHAYGGLGSCTGPVQLDIDQTRPGAVFSGGALMPHWDGYCQQIPYQVIAGGCSGKSCSVRFDFGIFWGRFSKQLIWLWSFWVSYQLPEMSVTEHDAWDDRCASYEARL